MGSTLEHGIYLPSEGEKNCYQGLASNWNKVDGALGDIAELRQLIENKFTKEIVTELPTEDINPYCIYMILKTDPETNNIYDEWVYINNAWEYLGNTKVDMTQYYTKQEVNELPAVASGVTSTKVGNYDTHIADTNIHVTASDKTKWNTVALIKQLRLVNTQVGSATTIAFANIDDTNGIKVGDKCMDLDAKLFEITAVDTANQTVTVGSALIDLALDGNVVHKSGNETKTGNLDLAGDLNIQNPNTTASTPQLNLRNTKVARASSSETGAQLLLFTDKNARALSGVESRVSSNRSTSMTFIVYNTDSNNQTVSGGVSVIKTSTVTNFAPTTDNAVTCGRSVARWSGVYSTEYYYGANNTPFSDKFVTTDTAQTVSGSKTFSSNVNVYNSDNTANTPNIILKNSKDKRGSTTNTGEQNIFFLDKDNAQLGNIKCEIDSNGVSTLTLQCTNSSNSSSGIRLRRTSTGTFLQPVFNKGCNLGTNSYRWYDVQTRSINSLEPSSLSLPSQTYVDISSYFTNTGTGEYNTYTAPSNGWIFLRLGDISSCQARVLDSSDNILWGTSSSGSVEMITIPILSGCKLQTQWDTGSAVTVATARFIPCQGNV